MAFKKGQSGNPAGKPRGAKDKRTELRELLKPHQADVVTKVVELAKAGDTTAIRLVLERLCPPMRSQDATVTLPLTGDTLSAKAQQVLGAMAAGSVTPDQGCRFLEALSICARVQDADELSRRVAALEREVEAMAEDRVEERSL